MRDARPIFFFCYNLIIIFSFVCVSIIIIRKKISIAWLCSPPMSKSIISTVVNIEANYNRRTHMVGLWIFHKFFFFSSSNRRIFLLGKTIYFNCHDADFPILCFEKTNKWRQTITFLFEFSEEIFFFISKIVNVFYVWRHLYPINNDFVLRNSKEEMNDAKQVWWYHWDFNVEIYLFFKFTPVRDLNDAKHDDIIQTWKNVPFDFFLSHNLPYVKTSVHVRIKINNKSLILWLIAR